MRDAAENRRGHPRHPSYDGRSAAGPPAQTPEEFVAVLCRERVGHFIFKFLETLALSLELLFGFRLQQASDDPAEAP